MIHESTRPRLHPQFLSPPFSQSHLTPMFSTSPSPYPTQFYLHSWDSSKGILSLCSIDCVILVQLFIFSLPLFLAVICFQIFLRMLFYLFLSLSKTSSQTHTLSISAGSWWHGTEIPLLCLVIFRKGSYNLMRLVVVVLNQTLDDMYAVDPLR